MYGYGDIDFYGEPTEFEAQITDFVKERDAAFTAAVVEDDWEPVKKYLRRCGMAEPRNETVMKAGVYKAVRECAGIPENVKELAAEKCAAMGMSPSMFD